MAKWGCLSVGAVLVIAAIVGNWWVMGLAVSRQAAGSPTMTFVSLTNQSIAASQVQWPPAPYFKLRAYWREPVGSMRLWPIVKWSRQSPELSIPTWWPAVALLGCGGVFWRLDRRRAAYQCHKCGYDRRGLADEAICPECGAAATRTPEREP